MFSGAGAHGPLCHPVSKAEGTLRPRATAAPLSLCGAGGGRERAEVGLLELDLASWHPWGLSHPEALSSSEQALPPRTLSSRGPGTLQYHWVRRGLAAFVRTVVTRRLTLFGPVTHTAVPAPSARPPCPSPVVSHAAVAELKGACAISVQGSRGCLSSLRGPRSTSPGSPGSCGPGRDSRVQALGLSSCLGQRLQRETEAGVDDQAAAQKLGRGHCLGDVSCFFLNSRD